MDSIVVDEPSGGSDAGTVLIGGIPTSRHTRPELAASMSADVARARAGSLPEPRIVVGSNGFLIALYHSDPAFRQVIDQVDIVDADGMPLVLASRLLLREPLRQRVATTDFILDASAAAAADGTRFFFLGAKPGVARTAADRLLALYPDLQIAGVRHGYFDASEEVAICEEIKAARTDVLWLGIGSPQQERFAVVHRAHLAGLAWIRTCGGLFDHLGTDISRAPAWMQHAGLEWLHRALLEPRRLGTRYLLTNPVALFHLLTKTR